MNTVSLCCTTNNPNPTLLQKMLDSAVGFTQIIVHINGNQDITEIVKIPNKTIQLQVPGLISAAEGFNRTIARATTEWIIPVCDDDFFHSNNLSELLTWFRNTNISEDIVRYPIFGGNERDGWTEWLHPMPTYKGLRVHNMLPFSCLYRKSLWERVGGYDELPYNDWGIWMKIFKRGASVYTWNKPIYYFRSGIEQRLSDKEALAQPFDVIRENLINKAEHND